MPTISHLRRTAAAIVATVAIVFSGSFAAAQMSQVALTPDSVRGIIASYADVKTKADELKTQYGDPEGDDAASSWQAWLAVNGARSALDGVVQVHGFSDFPTWVSTFVSVAMAYAFVKEGNNVDAGMSDAMAAIQNNPNMTDAQKQTMMQQMQASMGAIDAMRPPQENLDAVTPYVEQLAIVLEDS